MPYTPPVAGTENWDVPLNQALADIHDTALAAQSTADGKSDLGHDHVIGDVTDLTSDLADHEARIALMESSGRWFSTSTATHTVNTEPVTGWMPIEPLAGVSVDSNGVWTFSEAGIYDITAGWSATFNLPADTGFNTNIFLSDVAVSVVYAQEEAFYVQYTTGDISAANTLATGPISLTAGAQLEMHVGAAQAITLNGGDGLQRTFIAIRRVS